MLTCLGWVAGGFFKFNVKGEKPGRAGDDGAARRSRSFGLEGLARIGSAGTGGIMPSSSSSLEAFLDRLLKKAIARALTLPDDFPCDLFEEADI